MTPELLSLIGGGASGFLFGLIGKHMEILDSALKRALAKQSAADSSADAAAKRSAGVWVRRGIVVTVLLALIVFPMINAYNGVDNLVELPARTGLIGFVQGVFGFGRATWEALQGYVILPEVRQTLLAITGFYFGSSQVR